MFLKSLTLRQGTRMIREIRFRRGLNLVVDTTTGRSTDSGNSVGKTSALRAVDFCLGGDGSRFFSDPEFKDRVNRRVFEFLEAGGVSFELQLEYGGLQLTVVREYKGPITVNGEEVSLTQLRSRLGLEIFGLTGAKPTFRQLIGKFIRLESYQTANTIKYLHPATKEVEYDSVYLFLFGFRDENLLEKRREIHSAHKKKQKQLEAVDALSPASLRQILAILDHNIEVARSNLAGLELSSVVAKEIGELEQLRGTISVLSLEISNSALRRRLYRESINRLSRSAVEIDTAMLDGLYREAALVFPSLAKQFGDVVAFHNRMVASKIRFIERSVLAAEREVAETQERLNTLLTRERAILRAISSTDALADVSKLHREIENLVAERSRRGAILQECDQLSAEVARLSDELLKASESIAVYRNELDRRVRDFNILFAEYSNRLYGESYVLSLEMLEPSDGKLLKIGIHNVAGNEGAGKKRAQVSAFDLALMRMYSQNHTRSARFTLHDRIEDVAINQLKTLFAIADSIDGQYIVAALSDRLEAMDQEWVRERVVLELSQGDKFFRLP